MRELAINTPRELAAPSAPAGNLIALALQSGASPDAIKTLCELQWKQEERQKETEFADSLFSAQAEMPEIHATAFIPKDDAGKIVRSRFEPLERIMDVVKPILKRHGLIATFSSTQDGNRQNVECRIAHRNGCSKSSTFAVLTSAPPKASGAQGDGSTYAYGQRYALCAALGIVVHKLDNDGASSDARAVGEYVSTEEAKQLADAARAAGMSMKEVKNVWAAVGANDFDHVPKARIGEAMDGIAKYHARKNGVTSDGPEEVW